MRRRRLSAVGVGVLAAVVAFVATVQLRSQVEVRRTLEGEDPTALAFLIDDLHTGNDALARELATLSARRGALRSTGGAAASQQLADEAARLQIVQGAQPARGPGVMIAVDAPLSPFDLQDAVNNLRQAGAEAVTVNDRRVVLGTVYREAAGAILVDGERETGPWTFVAIGDPARLQTQADLMTRSLRADRRVRSATFAYAADVTIRATVTPRPLVYGAA